MARRNISRSFAYPAGIGDVLVAAAALVALLRYGRGGGIFAGGIFLVIALGAADFVSAFFFGFASSETPIELFRPAVANNVTVFATGMIPQIPIANQNTK